eukprot:CAMPEP_0174838416 /NCGR_PEP_ID=MMETSP1114-20130205/7378_1 /TAXON_ID=312471 /ORGANISM="Neobodo designis, Strain CCAP 1951/1" /LENGTH=252 /DNA_ID=CAMNT_0016072513 /DNA_START=40 /DNA_END=798 /DNA_ORIENTATION=+
MATFYDRPVAMPPGAVNEAAAAFTLSDVLEGLPPLESIVTAAASVPAVVATAPGERLRSPAALPRCAVHVFGVPFPTGATEVVAYVRDEAAIVRWEHTTSMRTDFVVELVDAAAAEGACQRVNSIGFDRAPRAETLDEYVFAVPGASTPTHSWNDFSRPQSTEAKVAGKRGFGGPLLTWSYDANGVPFRVMTAAKSVRPRGGAPSVTEVEKMSDAEIAEYASKRFASRCASSDAWLTGQVPSLHTGGGGDLS